MQLYAHIVGWGMALPDKVMTNDDIAQVVDTSDEWIRARTGIRERRVAEKETTASLAIRAAREALDRARINPARVDLVVVATLTPEHIMPATACLVQDALGATQAGAFDLSAGCSGFVYALSVAASMIKSGAAKTAVVIGAETMTRLLDWEDRTTCILFGDGAGAVVLRASTEPGGVLATMLGSDGSGGDHLIVPAGGSKVPASIHSVAERQHYIKMNGREVFRFATRVMGKAAKEACERAGIGINEIDLFVPHQANTRIIKSAAKYLKLSDDKVYENLHKYGNTSCASIPIALCEALQESRIKDKDNLVFVGFGAGLTWGATVVQWGLPQPYQKRSQLYRVIRWLYYRWAEVSSRLRRTAHTLDTLVPRRTYQLDDELKDTRPIKPIAPPLPVKLNGHSRHPHPESETIFENGLKQDEGPPPLLVEPSRKSSDEPSLN